MVGGARKEKRKAREKERVGEAAVRERQEHFAAMPAALRYRSQQARQSKCD